jgi:hypothetical protein
VGFDPKTLKLFRLVSRSVRLRRYSAVFRKMLGPLIPANYRPIAEPKLRVRFYPINGCVAKTQ